LFFGSNANVPNETSWPAGDWVVRYEVTTANTALDVEEVHVDRMNSGCTSQANVGNLTALNNSLSAGVHSHTVSGAVQTAAATDTFHVIIGCQRDSHGAQTAGITPSQNIDAPFTAAAGGVVRSLAASGGLAGLGGLAGQGGGLAG
jgi:hypothetical protein